MGVSLDEIRQASKALEGQIIRTPTVYSGRLSELLGCRIYCKLETLQQTGSFKDRGAYIKLQSLSDEQKAKGVIAVSAGNHAQGVAYHAQRQGIPATILMPEATPFAKVTRTQQMGARVLLQGDTLNAAEPYAEEIAQQEGLTFVHPYHDEKIIVGQGTIGLEILEELDDLDALIVPIGGGGLISGIATAVKALKPEIEVIGVEAASYPSMYQKIHGLEPKFGGETLAEGIAVKLPGEKNVEIVRQKVDDIVLVDEESLEAAVQSMIETAKMVVEGAGAAPLAAVQADRERFAGKQIGLIVGGSNISPRLLASVLMRGMTKKGQLIRFVVEIQDSPGVLGKVASHFGECGANILDVSHQRMFHNESIKKAKLDIVTETRDMGHAREIINRLEAAGFRASLVPHASYV